MHRVGRYRLARSLVWLVTWGFLVGSQVDHFPRVSIFGALSPSGEVPPEKTPLVFCLEGMWFLPGPHPKWEGVWSFEHLHAKYLLLSLPHILSSVAHCAPHSAASWYTPRRHPAAFGLLPRACPPALTPASSSTSSHPFRGVCLGKA